ncbi:hypothetical protein CKO25_09420 [Thiocapsa imhoffii]|uniref:Glycosyltransferase family 1 protein n=1 Tax=Thiocapsa imhoffii TaxID=382777 RepID=A0A9X0WHX0_9GAMM|nr:glycosyltransferase family 4 protein [Thiocapsa imhoffii]MBK1644863.1 hypothetical protein [Thiocapsa imhoffii]
MQGRSLDRVNVLFIVPSLCRAGAETQVVNLVNGLDSKYFNKHLLVFEENIDQLSRVDRKTVTFHHPRRTRRWFDVHLLGQIINIVDNHKIDIVHCSLQFSIFWGWLASRLSQQHPKVIAAIHTTINRNLKNELQDRLIYQWILRSCHEIIFVCRQQQLHWKAKYSFLKHRSTVIYNGINTDWFSPESVRDSGIELRRFLSIPSDAILIASIGRFQREKGQHLLIESLDRLTDQSIYVVFAGDGPLRREIEERCDLSFLSSQVRFLGAIPDVRPLLATANLLVLPSIAVETFSMAMLESLAMETPVLASDIGGMREAVIENETGSLIPIGDVDALTHQLSRLIADRTHLHEMGVRGRALVMDQFTESRMIEHTAAILAHLSHIKTV